MKARIALISEHASPLAAPLGLERWTECLRRAMARHLATRGMEVDVFTRRDRIDHPCITNGCRCASHSRTRWPCRVCPKEQMLPFMHEFATFMRGFIVPRNPTIVCMRTSSCQHTWDVF